MHRYPSQSRLNQPAPKPKQRRRLVPAMSHIATEPAIGRSWLGCGMVCTAANDLGAEMSRLDDLFEALADLAAS